MNKNVEKAMVENAIEIATKNTKDGKKMTREERIELISNSVWKKFENDSPVHVTEKMNGKMEMLQSVSTSVLLNTRCQKNASIEGSICSKCYASEMNKNYDNLNATEVWNTLLLTTSILAWDKLPFTSVIFFRFEAFGDLNNDIQFINYIHICEKNPYTQFSIWTKNPDIMGSVFKAGYKKPANLKIIVSSLFVNVENKALLKKYTFIDKLFTVYTAQYAIDNDIEINCGSSKCFSCRKCYGHDHDDIIFIHEMLKEEQKKYEKLLKAKARKEVI